ncbi:MAG: alpha-amylase family glycosyl hydrolase [Anaerolineaceae bacterium]|nr:alpha-amylase family glycosyl hydrolase [Anaerolineaceae bacterium]
MKHPFLRLLVIFCLVGLVTACSGGPPRTPTLAPEGPVKTQTQQPVLIPTNPPATTSIPTTLPVRIVSPIRGLPQGTDGYPWWNDSVFYEIFVRSFYDSNGDGIGDLRGLIAKLDYLNDNDPSTQTDLGVSAIWLMPINPSPSYHGYDITDYYTVNPDYGSLDDMKELIRQAHRRGIRVIMDLVPNHTSSKHPWFIDAQKPGSKYHDYYVWGGKEHAGDSQWHLGTNGQYYYSYFNAGMPDLNYTNPAVTREMENVVKFWLNEVGVDGFRIDAIRNLIEEGSIQADSDATHSWLKQFRKFYKGINPQAVTIGEIMGNTSAVVKYVQGDELDLAFDFDLAQATVTSINVGKAASLNQALDVDYHWFNPNEYASFLTNHDQTRSMSLFRNNIGKAKSAISLLLTSPGVPFLYYGEEIGMLGQKPDPEIRTPMQWTADKNAGFTSGTPWEAGNPDYQQKSVAVMDGDPASLLNYYRTLVSLRNSHAALRVGNLTTIDTGNPEVIAYLRESQNEKILVVANLNKEAQTSYHLTLKSGDLKGNYQAAPIIGTGAFRSLSANLQGGFEAYLPTPTLFSNQTLILQLQQQ